MLDCPLPLSQYDRILVAHGGGGRLTQQLIQKIFQIGFGTVDLPLTDGAVFGVESGSLAMTTDSYVVQPLFFPGGDIGRLAIWGTANDLAMMGAQPQYLSAGFILEEGLAIADLWRVVQSMREAADRLGLRIVTGDTKVVERGKGDGMFINTSGVGRVLAPAPLGPAQVCPGDRILISGDLGRHGMAILAARQNLGLSTPLESDLAPLWPMVQTLFEHGIVPHCLRDLTRGGLASALHEIARDRGVNLSIEEEAIAIPEAVQGICELLGLDPLYVANEGRMVLFVPPHQADRTLALLRQVQPGAAIVGIVGDLGEQPWVTVRSGIGGERLLDLLSGEQLPRIC